LPLDPPALPLRRSSCTSCQRMSVATSQWIWAAGEDLSARRGGDLRAARAEAGIAYRGSMALRSAASAVFGESGGRGGKSGLEVFRQLIGLNFPRTAVLENRRRLTIIFSPRRLVPPVRAHRAMRFRILLPPGRVSLDKNLAFFSAQPRCLLPLLHLAWRKAFGNLVSWKVRSAPCVVFPRQFVTRTRVPHP